MKNVLLCTITLLLLGSCKKEKQVNVQPVDDYESIGLGYITTIKGNASEVLPVFAGKIPGEDAYKFIYTEKGNGITNYRSHMLASGERKDWEVNFSDKYTYATFALSNNGSFICNAYNNDIVEISENHFTVIHNHHIRNGDAVIGIKPEADHSEVNPNTFEGSAYKNVSILSDFDNVSGFNKKVSLGFKLWNNDICEYDGENLLFVYTKGATLFASLLDKNLKETNLSSIHCQPTWMHSGCDFGVLEGLTLRVIKNGKEPFILLGMEYKANFTHAVFQLKNNRLQPIANSIENSTLQSYQNLFAWKGRLYDYSNLQLQRLEGGEFRKVKLPDVNILGLYGSEEGIFLATRKKGDSAANYFDVVRWEP